METKVTTASIRIAISHQYSTFEVAMNLDNTEGISTLEIEQSRKQCHDLATNAVTDYKAQLALSPKDQQKALQKRIDELKSSIGVKDNVDASKIEGLPLYEGKNNPDKKGSK